MASFVSSSPQLYAVAFGTYGSNWTHGLEAPNLQSLSGDQIIGLSTITVAPNIPYYGNNYCNLITEGNVCKISMQYDLNCSVGSIVQKNYNDQIYPQPFELRFSNQPNLFPVAIGEPLLKCRITIINTGQDIPANQLNFYGRLLKDGTIALVLDYILVPTYFEFIIVTDLGPVALNTFNALLPYWNANQAVGISICIEDSFLVE